VYHHYYDKLSQDHRQRVQADAERRRVANALPRQYRQPGLGRHALGKLGAALVALGSRLERIEQSGKPAMRELSPALPSEQ
jgi:hypothetical protein